MRDETFGLQHRPTMPVRHYPDQIAPLMREADEWAERFGAILSTYLVHNTTPGEHAAVDMFDQYEHWNLKFPDLVNQLETMPDGDLAVHAMHFHTLTYYLKYMWLPTLGSRQRPNPYQLRQMQLMLAHHAVIMLKAKHRNHLTHFDQVSDRYRQGVEASQHGMLTEDDAAIVLIEIVRHLRDVVVVSAPPQFEASHKNTNVDFIVLDLARRTANGIQVKTSVDYHTRNSYHDDVTLIDGRLDLGNERPIRPDGSSREHLAAWPGLISAHFMLKANPKTPPFQPYATLITDSRKHLKDLVHGTSDFLPRAVTQLTDRILSPLDDTDTHE